MTQVQAPPSPPPPPPPVDPRFRRRWVEARREEGRRRLRLLAGALVALFVVAAGMALVHTPLFKVRRVVVYGDAHTARAQVLAASGLGPGDGTVLMVDAGSARAVRAVDALPWVGKVRFSRRWPWTLAITITERTPAALVEGRPPAPGGRASDVVDVVDKTGRVLGTLEGLPRHLSLPVVAGLRTAAPGQRVLPAAGLSRPAMADLLQAAAATAPALAQRGLDLSYERSSGLVATLGSAKALIVLGSSAQVAMKLAVLGELAQRVDLGNYAEVDLTVPQRPALTPLNDSASG